MPDGRFLSKSIAHDLELNAVSLEADYLFARCIPHLDREGRMAGHPEQVKSITVPLRKEVSAEEVDRCLGELAEAGLLLWYEVEGRPILEFPRFDRHQRGLRKDREAESIYPSSKVQKAQPLTTLLRSNSGVGPEQVRSRSASTRPKSSKVKLSQAKGSEVKKTSSPTPPSQDPDGAAREDDDNLEREIKKHRPKAKLNIIAIHGGTEKPVTIEGHRVGVGIEIDVYKRLCRDGHDPPEIIAAAIAYIPVVSDLQPPVSLARWGAEDGRPIYEQCVGRAYKEASL